PLVRVMVASIVPVISAVTGRAVQKNIVAARPRTGYLVFKLIERSSPTHGRPGFCRGADQWFVRSVIHYRSKFAGWLPVKFRSGEQNRPPWVWNRYGFTYATGNYARPSR